MSGRKQRIAAGGLVNMTVRPGPPDKRTAKYMVSLIGLVTEGPAGDVGRTGVWQFSDDEMLTVLAVLARDTRWASVVRHMATEAQAMGRVRETWLPSPSPQRADLIAAGRAALEAADARLSGAALGRQEGDR